MRIAVVAHERRIVKGDGKTGFTMRQQIMKTLVCFLWASQAGEHSHRPEPSPVHGGLDSPGERIDTRKTNISGIVNVFYIFRGLKAFDLKIRDSGKPWETFRSFAEDF